MVQGTFRKGFLFLTACATLLVPVLAYLSMVESLAPRKDPVEVVKRYLTAVYARDYHTAYQWISAEDRRNKSEEDYLRENPSFSGAALELTRKLAQMIAFQNIQSDTRENRATVRFMVRLPNAGDPKLEELFLDFDEERLTRLSKEEIQAIEQKLESMRKHGILPMIEGEDSLELISEDNQWKVFANWAGAIRVRFKAEVKENLAWEFRPVQETILATPGETLHTLYKVKNLSDKPITAKARHLDEPKKPASEHLEIVQCFCFIQQTLAPGEEKELPLVFRVYGNVPSDVKEFRVNYEFYPIDKFPEG